MRWRTKSQKRHQRPCCGALTLDERGSHEICPVCHWQDNDATEQFGEPAEERPRGPNHVHLWRARENFIAFGAAEGKGKDAVLPRRTDERPASLRGLPLAIDETTEQADNEIPVFLNRPPGAPVYYGFPILDDVEVHGFHLGIISDFETEESNWGDSFVVAPDGSRCGLVWVTKGDDRWRPGGFDEIIPPDADRWGVWQVAFPYPMRTRDDARLNLAWIVRKLCQVWLAWQERFQP